MQQPHQIDAAEIIQFVAGVFIGVLRNVGTIIVTLWPIIIVLILVALAGVGLRILNARTRTRPPKPTTPTKTPAAPAATYKAKRSLNTATELRHRDIIQKRLQPHEVLMTQVALSEIIEPLQWTQADWNRISQKRVDFVVCHRDTHAVLRVIEIDDPSHRRPDRIARDQFLDRVLGEAGIPVQHVILK